ncbi:hypothetical protein Stsp02_12150 [Streptomyces sp. NBRC 14336]|nr:hypothetical protein Stsp02_12150 [Streptomyces sp. NBRC 14336]
MSTALGERRGSTDLDLGLRYLAEIRECGSEKTPLTVADPCIWHGSGTNLSRRKSATTAGAPPDGARVCLAALPPVHGTLVFAPPKRGKLRDVPLDPEVSAALREHMAAFPPILPYRHPWAETRIGGAVTWGFAAGGGGATVTVGRD